MAHIISHSSIERGCDYSLSFVWRSDPNAGFSFSCDENGKVTDLKPASQENYEKCLNGTHDVICKGIVKYEWHYPVPAELRCDCGCTVTLDSFTNTCDKCYRDYNSSGMLLAHRSQWGEETGEHWSECY